MKHGKINVSVGGKNKISFFFFHYLFALVTFHFVSIIIMIVLRPWNYCIVLDFLGFRSNGDTFLSIENGTFGDISAGNHLQLN